MESSKMWSNILAPSGWADVIMRTIKVFLIALVVYHIKEYIDAGRFDTIELAIDALWLAGGALIIEAVLLVLISPKAKRVLPVVQRE